MDPSHFGSCISINLLTDMSSGSQYSCEVGSPKFYTLCAFGGLLSCGLTHTAVVPLDLVKCRIQVWFSFERVYSVSTPLLQLIYN